MGAEKIISHRDTRGKLFWVWPHQNFVGPCLVCVWVWGGCHHMKEECLHGSAGCLSAKRGGYLHLDLRARWLANKQSDSRDRGLISSLPIPYCANSLLYVDFIHGLPRFGGYDSCLVVTCGLSRFTRVFPCNKKITGEQTVKMLVEQWFEPYGTPKQVHSDEDVRIRSDTGWYKRVLNALNVFHGGRPAWFFKPPFFTRTSRALWEIGWNTSSLWLTRLGLT